MRNKQAREIFNNVYLFPSFTFTFYEPLQEFFNLGKQIRIGRREDTSLLYISNKPNQPSSPVEAEAETDVQEKGKNRMSLEKWRNN